MLKLICILFLCTYLVIAQTQLVLTDIFRQPLPNDSSSFDRQDLDEGKKQAKQASKDVFKGLKQAKEQVGKTQTRKQAMEEGHQKASAKLEDLADRAKAAQTPEDLNPVDRTFLKNLQGKS
jgi:hypothetical protein